MIFSDDYMIFLDGVKKSYENPTTKQKVTIGPLSIGIKKGEFIVFLSPSGGGKSTTLRMIAGLEDIDDGTIYISGKICNHVVPSQRGVSMVFQDYGLYPHMTIEQNLTFYLELQKYPKEEIQKRLKETAELLQIADQLYKKPAKLSGGQRQRVAIGRSLMREALILLFDEPLGAVDIQMRDQLRKPIKRLHQEKKMTVIYVTHDQKEAMSLADRLVLMKSGQIEQTGSATELYQKPKNMFVAGFLGSPSINFLHDVQIQEKDSACAAIGKENAFVLPLPMEMRKHIGRQVILGIRPHDIFLKSNGYASEVTLVEEIQPNLNITVRLGSYQLTLETPESSQNKPCVGSALPIEFDSTKVILFDPKTQENLNNGY